ncbi:hypothetical protein [Streptomyces sp. TRM49041]|uniref:hypothetical protein n=1 Tax=Streptomyces sp. TRM49041 TaxID=2603216 RepID=UPI0011EFC66D|nr:hypothetical protein [Streptomyces sp. TRM49041]
MKKSTLRSAAAAAALATGLATASVTTASAAERPAVGRIATPQQLAESIRQAVELEESRGGAVAEGNVIGYVAPQADSSPKPC